MLLDLVDGERLADGGVVAGEGGREDRRGIEGRKQVRDDVGLWKSEGGGSEKRGSLGSERAVERDTHGRSWPGGREHTRASIGKAKIQAKEEGIQV